MDDLEEFRTIFFQECQELLTSLEEAFSSIEAGTAGSDTINAAFRAIHSIKGGAGAFGFDGMVDFCHTFESVMDQLRNDKIKISPLLIRLMLRSKDIVTDLVEAAQANHPNLGSFGQDIKKELTHVLETGVAPDPAAFDGSAAPTGKIEKPAAKPTAATPPETSPPPVAASSPIAVTAAPVPETSNTSTEDDFSDEPVEREIEIVFNPDHDCLRAAIEPLQILDLLKGLGTVNASISEDTLPDFFDLDPTDCYFKWNLTLYTTASVDDVEDVFFFAKEYAQVSVTEIREEEEEKPQPIVSPPPAATTTATPPLKPDIGEESPSSPISVAVETRPVETPSIGENENTVIASTASSASSGAQTQATLPPLAPTASHKANITLRVDLFRIDRLVNMVGETVITQSVLAQQASMLSPETHSGLLHAIEALSRQTRELQESVMSIRAQPVKNVFQRMNRLVRELGLALGKEVKLVLHGEQTEVDTTVIEELAEPLTHMIRNSMDHGLESTAERVAKGKPTEGTIRISAEHRSSRIVITVSDDGRGINRERVLQKATENGLVSPEAKLTPEEIENLIFLPGFSTAEAVSNISGRGVGMDVVRQKIQSLGGRVFISSRPGKGTTFTMTLPLTLAVLDGMVIRIGSENFIIPITSIIEASRFDNITAEKLPNGGSLVNLRGNYVKLINLGDALNVPLTGEDPQIVVVETEGFGQVGMIVDDLIGQQQIVIKSLETNYRRVEGISGATILGDGNVALILDVDSIAGMDKNSSGGGSDFSSSFVTSMEVQ